MTPPCKDFLESSGRGMFHLCFVTPSANLSPSLSFLSSKMGKIILSTLWDY